MKEVVCERGGGGRGKDNVRARSLSCNKITARALSLRYETLIHSRDFVPISLIDFTKSGSKGLAASLLIPSTAKIRWCQKCNNNKKVKIEIHTIMKYVGARFYIDSNCHFGVGEVLHHVEG